MRVLIKEEFLQEKDTIRNRLKEENLVLVYPTDTIYGIGCNALSKEAVQRIRKIKKRESSPFSVIAPSKEWIVKNCSLNENAKEWLKKLPGPYTLVLKTKEECVAKNVAPGLKTLGIRIPDHWFSDFAKEMNIPIISTSANVSGNDFMTSLEDLDEDIKGKVDFIVYEGVKEGKPSRIIDLTGRIKVIER